MTGGLAPVEQVLADLLASIDTLEPETVPVSEALGRVLATELRAPSPLPPHDNAAMDGYAVRAADTSGASVAHPATLTVVGSSFAGDDARSSSVARGQAVVVATGARMPPGTDAVARVEHTTRHEDVVTIHDEVRRGADVRRCGEDLAAGDLVLRPGTVLGPGQLAAASGTDHAQVEVTRRPDVAVVLTGDEIRAAGAASDPTEAGLPDAVGGALVGLVRDWGAGSIELHGPVPDDRERIRTAVRKLAPRTGVLVTVGGVSKGERDHLPAVVAELGAISAGGVALRPGKPFRHGRIGETTVLCLPGNPAAALVAATVFLRPTIALMRGADTTAGTPLRARLTETFRHAPGRQHWVRAQVAEGAAGRTVRPVGRAGSAMLHSLAAANAWMVVRVDVAALHAGDEVDVVPMWGDGGRSSWRS